MSGWIEGVPSKEIAFFYDENRFHSIHFQHNRLELLSQTYYFTKLSTLVTVNNFAVDATRRYGII